jgi:hypothetical protein
MKNTLYLLAILMVTAFTNSCQIGEEEVEVTADCDFLHARTGTSWKYQSGSFEYTSTITGKKTIDDQDVLVGKTSLNNGVSYIGCLSNGIVLASENTTSVSGSVTADQLMMAFYFDKAIGVTWDGPKITMESAGYEVVYDYKIALKKKNQSVTVNGTQYTGVYVFEMKTYMTISGVALYPDADLKTEYYFAPQIGPVRTKVFSYNFLSDNYTLSSTTDLIEYVY